MYDTLSNLIEDERAVSPVIGVILMVAITVILAAVIGTFVLDIGQSAGQTAPQASLTVSLNTANNNTTLDHTGGDSLNSDSTRVIISNGTDSITYNVTPNTNTFGVGESVVFNVGGAGGGNVSSGPWTGMQATGTVPFDSGEEVTVTVIDTDSQRQIFETTVTA